MVVTASIDSSSGICGKARIKIFELYLALKYKRHNLYYKHFTEKCFVMHVKRMHLNNYLIYGIYAI